MRSLNVVMILLLLFTAGCEDAPNAPATSGNASQDINQSPADAGGDIGDAGGAPGDAGGTPGGAISAVDFIEAAQIEGGVDVEVCGQSYGKLTGQTAQYELSVNGTRFAAQILAFEGSVPKSEIEGDHVTNGNLVLVIKDKSPADITKLKKLFSNQ